MGSMYPDSSLCQLMFTAVMTNMKTQTLIRTGAFLLDRLLSHVDPGPREESDEFVRCIYEQRNIDLSSDCND